MTYLTSRKRIRRRGLSAVIFLFLWGELSAQIPSFHAEVQAVEVPVTVLDENGRIVSRLRKEDFRLFENGIPQRIRDLALDIHTVNVLLLLDLSRSVQAQKKNIRVAAQKFVKQFGPQDRFAVIGFAHGMMPVQDWTTDKNRILKSIGKLETGTQTQLYDAIQTALENQAKPFPGRKACILFTDGIDTSSERTLQAILRSVYRKEMCIYVINILKAVKGSMERYKRIAYVARLMEKIGEKDYLENFFLKKEEEMNQLAVYSGGRAFFLDNLDDMQGICNQVALELKSQYVLTYIPENNPSSAAQQNIKLEFTPAPLYQVIYRRGYFLSQSTNPR
jgi:Ca-activated chloride channel homolog